MVRILSLSLLALLALSSLIYAAAASEPDQATADPQVQASVLPLTLGTDMPPPQAPFDETPITPVESTGAPMYP
jgi:hypothetical protein